ncbi:DNA topoisomerase [Shewanella sairae]|uniref:DNA topoisomerase n=1 Tax=Shewanella sairae TaxID=190310 RepID=A0ABQ4P741_9GAMM|nr:DNA topoisomerase III [Shewanella sairae]MCL1130508.1 DNA topoisomerase III [Shewanella sairae]GIU42956.1 DNA topoisomerase [Shewanella sairae]
MQVYLCEKPSQAKDIATVLGCTRKDGVFSKEGVMVVNAIGHLLQQADPQDYNPDFEKWNMADLPIIPGTWKMVVTPKTKAQFAVVKKALAKATEVIIATDADREGEVIAREILEFVNYKGAIRRLWLSALDEASIRKALGALRANAETEKLYDAGLGRSRGDWLIGMNMTRLCTLLSRADGYSGALSVGRVQTPTLRLVVDRDRQIEQFSPAAYYDVTGLFSAAIPFKAKWQAPENVCDEHGRCLQTQIADGVIAQCQGQSGIVTTFDTKRQKAKHPALYFLGSLQKTMSAKYGYGAKDVLDIAQSLYEKHKVTTYPRTDCPYLPLSQHGEVAAIIGKLSAVPAFAGWCSGANPQEKSACWNDKKITAHHGIIPLPITPNLEAMSEKERNLYLAIVQRYLAQFYPVAEDDATTVELTVGAHRFKANGKVERVKGWRIVTGKEEDDTVESNSLPQLSIGQSLPGQYQRDDKKTKPPSRFTEGTLIDAMSNIAKFETDPKLKSILKETAGIGTEATRANIIDTLKARGFLTVSGKQLISDATGRSLIDALPDVLTRPSMTALWEQALDDIALGNGSLTDFMAKQQGFVTQLVALFKQGQYSLKLPKIEQVTAPCPACKKPMKLLDGKKGKFWACEDKDHCGLLLNDDRGKLPKTAPCTCTKGVLVRKKAKTKGKFWWGCSAFKSGCQRRLFDNEGKPGKEMDRSNELVQ